MTGIGFCPFQELLAINSVWLLVRWFFSDHGWLWQNLTVYKPVKRGDKLLPARLGLGALILTALRIDRNPASGPLDK